MPERRPTLVHDLGLALRIEVLTDLAHNAHDLALPRLQQRGVLFDEMDDFPGNVRELRNILERATLLADDDLILPQHLSAEVANKELTPNEKPLLDTHDILPLEEIERRYLVQALSTFEGDRDALAHKLGISKRTLFRKLQNLQVR